MRFSRIAINLNRLLLAYWLIVFSAPIMFCNAAWTEKDRAYLLLDKRLIAVGVDEYAYNSIDEYDQIGRTMPSLKARLAATTWVFVDGFQPESEELRLGEKRIRGNILVLMRTASVTLDMLLFNRKAENRLGYSLPKLYAANGFWGIKQESIDDLALTAISPPKSIQSLGFSFDPYSMRLKRDHDTTFEEKLFVFQNDKLILEGAKLFHSENPTNNTGAPLALTLDTIGASVLKTKLRPTVWFQGDTKDQRSVTVTGQSITISSRHLFCTTDHLTIERTVEGTYQISPFEIPRLIQLSSQQQQVLQNIPCYYRRDYFRTQTPSFGFLGIALLVLFVVSLLGVLQWRKATSG